MRQSIVRQSIAFAACLLAAPFMAHAQTSGSCTAGTLNGTYSLTLTGRAVTSTVVISKTYEAVGTILFDGVSGVTATLTTNTNQEAGVQQTLAGTYTIPTTCVGTVSFTSGDVASYTLIPYNNGNDFIITGQDATYELTGTGGPQPVSCLTSTLSGVYAFSGSGFALSTGAITGVNNISGLFQFDGAGAVTGNWSVATNGTATPDTVSGQYSVSAACVGSATVKDANGLAYTLSYAVTSADGANIAIVGAAATNIFTSTMHSTFTNPGLAVANAAGVSGGTPAGSLFSIYGSNLATGQAQPSSAPYPTMLATASVTVNGELAPLSYVNTTQINAQMPWDIAPGMATVVVTTGSMVSNAVGVTVPATAVPGVFIYGSNEAVAQNFPSYTLNSSAAPAPVGSVVIVYLTGGGPVQGGSVLVTGHETPGNTSFPVTEAYSATVAAVPATVDFIGLTPGFVGLYQANVVIPQVAKGNHNLVITIGGTASAATTISTN